MKESNNISRVSPITARHKASGNLAAFSLGDLHAPEKRKMPLFKKAGPRHRHAWIYGTNNAVCTKCGETVPKDQVPQT